MNLLDVLIVVAAAVYAVGGYRSGALVAVCSLVGFAGGAVAGAQLARPLGSRIADGRAQVPVAILCVLVAAMLGQVVAVFIGSRLRQRMVRGRARVIDAVAGAGLGVLGVLLVAWMLAVPLASSPYPRLASLASRSSIVREVDDVVPNSWRTVYASLRNFLDRSGFPPVLGDLPSTTIVGVAPPAALTDAQRQVVTRARRSTFKVYGQAPECGRGIEGSAFVVAPHRLLTNAHVVAGTRAVQVQTSGGLVRARVVLFDAGRDVAVLAVPALHAPALRLAGAPATAGTPAVVLGYPQDGPFTVRTARVRSSGLASGRDIYNRRSVPRDIYAVRAVVRAGNSGGPLLADDGSVLGMVFATAADSPDTGFALTAREIGEAAMSAPHLRRSVGTQGCTPE